MKNLISCRKKADGGRVADEQSKYRMIRERDNLYPRILNFHKINYVFDS